MYVDLMVACMMYRGGKGVLQLVAMFYLCFQDYWLRLIYS